MLQTEVIANDNNEQQPETTQGTHTYRHVVDLLQVSRLADEAQIAQHLGLVGGGTARCVVHRNAAVTVRVIKLVRTGLQVLDQL